jgi:hypothetical protein
VTEQQQPRRPGRPRIIVARKDVGLTAEAFAVVQDAVRASGRPFTFELNRLLTLAGRITT